MPEFEETIGQDRAVRAIDFGLRMRGSGYNLYVLGPQGEQKRSLVLQHLESKASGRDRHPDWCYVNRFTDPQRSRAIALPAGRGAELREDMRKLVDELRVSIPAVFESEEYRQRMAELEEEFEERHKQELGALQEEAERRGMTLLQTPHGFAVAPTVEGKVIGPEDFERLSNDDKRRLERTSGEIREKVRKYFETCPSASNNTGGNKGSWSGG